jgi:hypothetical protein
MSPSLLFLGRRVCCLSVSGLSTHCFTLGSTICRRHFPIWMTSGMFEPTGTSFSVNFPCVSVSVVTTGEPLATPPHLSHVAPCVIGSTGAFGT